MNANRSKGPRVRPGGAPPPPRRAPRSRTPVVVAVLVVLAVIGLFVIYRTSTTTTGTTTGTTSGTASGTASGATSGRFDVGSPGIGATAPGFVLPDVTAPPTAGGQPTMVELSAYRGKTVLLYFHEGLGCQPCWDQIRDLQADPGLLSSVGVDQLLTITTGPPDLVAQKMRDDGLSAPALVDTGLRVSTQYEANRYGMMGTSRDGHSFVLVGPDGVIQWRADYGGPPNYTMYVPNQQLLEDLRAGRRDA